MLTTRDDFPSLVNAFFARENNHGCFACAKQIFLFATFLGPHPFEYFPGNLEVLVLFLQFNMCWERTVAFRFFASLKELLWLAYLALKVVDASPM